MSPSSGVPAELFAEIFQHIHHRSTLFALALSSKAVSSEAIRALYLDVDLKSITGLDSFAKAVIRRPERCIKTWSFSMRHRDDNEHFWTEDRRIYIHTIISHMPSLIRVVIDIPMKPPIWFALTSSLERSGAKIREFRCWRVENHEVDACQAFLHSQPSILALYFTGIDGTLNSNLPLDLLPNLILLSGRYAIIKPFIRERPLRRLQVLDSTIWDYSRQQYLKIPSLTIFHIAHAPTLFGVSPNMTFLDCICRQNQVSFPGSFLIHPVHDTLLNSSPSS